MPSGLNATLVTMSGVAGQRLRRPVGRWPHPTPAPCCRTAGGDAGAVGAERHTVHRVGVAGERLAEGWPVAASHSRTVLSSLPEAIRVPSGLNATLDTDAGVSMILIV